MTDIIKQIAYLGEIMETLKETGTVTLDREHDKGMFEGLEKTLYSAITVAKRDEKLKLAKAHDFSLDRCIEYARDRRDLLSEKLKAIRPEQSYTEIMEEAKLLGCIEENLVAMSILANRMAEQLLKLPENHPKEAAKNG